MVIHLPSEMETALAREAQLRGITPEGLALDVLGEHLKPTNNADVMHATLLDFLSGYIGVVEGTGEAYSENCGQRFADGIAANNTQGRL